MITVQDLFNIIGGKISNEMGKTIIRNSFPPQIAEQMCNAIDCNEKAELLQKLSEWHESQNKQQQAIQSFLQQYYNR